MKKLSKNQEELLKKLYDGDVLVKYMDTSIKARVYLYGTLEHAHLSTFYSLQQKGMLTCSISRYNHSEYTISDKGVTALTEGKVQS